MINGERGKKRDNEETKIDRQINEERERERERERDNEETKIGR